MSWARHTRAKQRPLWKWSCDAARGIARARTASHRPMSRGSLLRAPDGAPLNANNGATATAGIAAPAPVAVAGAMAPALLPTTQAMPMQPRSAAGAPAADPPPITVSLSNSKSELWPARQNSSCHPKNKNWLQEPKAQPSQTERREQPFPRRGVDEIPTETPLSEARAEILDEHRAGMLILGCPDLPNVHEVLILPYGNELLRCSGARDVHTFSASPESIRCA